MRAQGGELVRIEVVPTQRHWETVHVASRLPLARGWERQLDMGRNAIFDAAELDPEAYHEWLREHAVRFVALADAPIDPSGVDEACLVGSGLPYLELVWRDRHWRLFRVLDAEPLVDGPARLVALDPERIVLDVTASAPVLVRCAVDGSLVARSARVRRGQSRRVDHRPPPRSTRPGDAARHAELALWPRTFVWLGGGPKAALRVPPFRSGRIRLCRSDQDILRAAVGRLPHLSTEWRERAKRANERGRSTSRARPGQRRSRVPG